MNESLWRWQGRIGSLKGLAFIVLIFVVIFSFPVIDNLNIAVRNTSGSQQVTISQLVSGNVNAKQYISVSGLASYDLAYTETEDGVTKAIIYPLIDRESGTVIFVRTTQTNLGTASDTMVTVAGLTSKAPSDLKRAIEKDIADINAAGFQTSTVLYIEDGKKPGQTIVFLMQLAGMGLVGILCIVTFFFPTIVFKVFPPQQVAQGEAVNNTVKATGTFVQVKKMEPLEFGKTKRKFTNSNANLLILDDKSLGVYIHFIYTTRVYGIQVSRQETDWMVLVKPLQIVAIEPGKLYGWRDLWALSVRYRDSNENEQKVLISFANAASQVNFVNYLRDTGFAVSSGQYPVSGPVWNA
jgi:hypothetical protein